MSRPPPPRTPSKPRRWLRRAVVAAVAAVLIPASASAAFWSAVWYWPYPRSADVARAPAKWVTDRHGVTLAAFAAPDGQWRMPLTTDQISPHLLSAIVAIEDHRFYEHGGIDWTSAAGSAWEDLSSLRIRRGASTITMQLHRLRDPAPRRRSAWAKIEQAIRAVQIERHASKEQVLVEYVNRAPFGGNLVGAGAASWRYFGRSCRDLSLAQAALLAGLPQNPNHVRPDRHPDAAKQRRDVVLDRMLALGMIDRRAHDRAAAEPLDLPPHADDQHDDDDAAGAMPTLITLAQQSDRPITRTTLDAATQRHAFDAARRQLQSLAPSGVGAAAVVVLDTVSGEERAAVSLATPTPTGIDLTARPRSTGSVLKTFIYAAAFEQRICAPDTVITDRLRAWGDFVPRNYDHAFRGALTAAEALAASRNLPALQLLAKIGVKSALATMADLGLSTLANSPPGRYGLSLAIGGAEASVAEVAQAYATLGRGGVSRGGGGGRSGKICLSPQACWQVLHALADPDRTAAVSPEAAGKAVAWKTGTSSDNRDAWCAAVTPAVTVVVWTGNVDGRGSSRLVGADAAAPLALQLAAALTPDAATFPLPSDADRSAATLASSRTRSDRLTILTPADGVELSPDPDAPLASQKIPLQIVATADASDSEPLWWFVDGRNITTSKSSSREPTWWTPTSSGDHEIRVVDAQGRWARVRVRVRDVGRASADASGR